MTKTNWWNWWWRWRWSILDPCSNSTQLTRCPEVKSTAARKLRTFRVLLSLPAFKYFSLLLLALSLSLSFLAHQTFTFSFSLLANLWISRHTHTHKYISRHVQYQFYWLFHLNPLSRSLAVSSKQGWWRICEDKVSLSLPLSLHKNFLPFFILQEDEIPYDRWHVPLTFEAFRQRKNQQTFSLSLSLSSLSTTFIRLPCQVQLQFHSVLWHCLCICFAFRFLEPISVMNILIVQS